MTTTHQGIAERARAAYRAEQERQAAQRVREVQEAEVRLLENLDKHLTLLGIAKENIRGEAGAYDDGPRLHVPRDYPGGNPDYAFVTIDGMVFAAGHIWGIQRAFVVSFPCASGDGQPSVQGHFVFTGVVQDHLRQLGKWVEEVFDQHGTKERHCADCLMVTHNDDE